MLHEKAIFAIAHTIFSIRFTSHNHYTNFLINSILEHGIPSTIITH